MCAAVDMIHEAGDPKLLEAARAQEAVNEANRVRDAASGDPELVDAGVEANEADREAKRVRHDAVVAAMTAGGATANQVGKSLAVSEAVVMRIFRNL
jgi:hypothetical protein